LSHARRVWLQKQADHLRELLQTSHPNGVSLRDLDVHHNRKADLINRVLAEFPHIFCLGDHSRPGAGRPSIWLKLKRGVSE
jgi:hypothetical protein